MITCNSSRLLAVATLVPALCVGLASPATAGPAKPQRVSAISATSCAAGGGVFSYASGARTCTTVRTVTTDGSPVTAEVTLMATSWPGGGARHTLRGTSYRRSTAVTTTTRIQSAGRAVTASSTVEQTSAVVPVSCVERVTTSQSGYTDRTSGSLVEGRSETTETDMPLLRCEQDQLFVA